ncbi:hypothetical protein D9613_011414 [Agrocybe pediades]|uniref:pyranose dehydrogenase (acceptor) n=1 Tax=Agrocybe pediades TaxID=84607 RepID=A0A8H4QRW0_9AGAR|nr:hypothetical protein D9613_011414 [Agrocybe pediades]
MRSPALLLVLSGLAVPAFAAIYTKPLQLPRITYDYVIVGAGNAGLVVANRLTENPKIQVLVLEAGISDENVLPVIVPFLGPTATPNTPFDWNYTVTPQTNLDNRAFPYPRGKILGGCSTVNYMTHHYGSSDDYDKLARDTGDAGWSWNNMQKYIQAHEKFVPPADGHNTTGQFIPEKHGFKGVTSISLPGNSQGIDARVLSTLDELKSEFPFNPDMGGGDILGIGWAQSSIGNGTRSSSSTSYLRDANSRPNLHVLIHATVTKLIPNGFKNGRVSFGGVMFTSTNTAIRLPSFVYATKEIILSAGSIGTPQILLLSGIGPKKELSAMGIPTIIDNASVGKNMSEHVLVPNIFQVTGSESLDELLRGGSFLDTSLAQWTANKTGPLSNSVTNQLGFLRLPQNSSIFQTVPDPSTGPKSSHFEFVIANFWLNPGISVPATGRFFTIVTALISPTSRGFVKLASTDPFKAPIINPQLLSTAFDRFAIREAVKATKRFASASAWKDYIIAPFGSNNATTDDEIDAHVRSLASTVFHPIGTATMTKAGASWGVVDPNLKLKGAEGIRIVDASVWPTIPNAHTQGPTYLVAERASDLIKADQ